MDLNSEEMKTTVAELKQKHGDLRMLTREGQSVIVRRATEAEWEAHMANVLDAARKAQASRALLSRLVVYPAKPELDAMLAKRPGLINTFAGELGEFCGIGEAEKKDL